MTSHPARILYVHNSADLYGASRSLLRLTSRLDGRRFLPVVVLPEEGPLAAQLREAGVETVQHASLPLITRSLVRSWKLACFPWAFVTSFNWLKRMIRGRRIDLVHTNTGVMPTPAWAATRAGVPHVWHIRDWFQEFRGLWGPYSRYILGHSTRVLAVSEAIAAQFADRSRVQVLHNGFDLSEFRVPREEHARAFRAQWQLGDDMVVGTVGRIKLVRKGQEVLIEAARELARRRVRAKFVIVGAPFPGNESHLAELHRRVRDYGLQDAVVFTGELADPRPAYGARRTR
jgi:glycosyltransferase involved in cell wall biosynthesis